LYLPLLIYLSAVTVCTSVPAVVDVPCVYIHPSIYTLYVNNYFGDIGGNSRADAVERSDGESEETAKAIRQRKRRNGESEETAKAIRQRKRREGESEETAKRPAADRDPGGGSRFYK
jgi:hypothetical protein